VDELYLAGGWGRTQTAAKSARQAAVSSGGGAEETAVEGAGAVAVIAKPTFRPRAGKRGADGKVAKAAPSRLSKQSGALCAGAEEEEEEEEEDGAAAGSGEAEAGGGSKKRFRKKVSFAAAGRPPRGLNE
jgi:hypothetical protein